MPKRQFIPGDIVSVKGKTYGSYKVLRVLDREISSMGYASRKARMVELLHCSAGTPNWNFAFKRTERLIDIRLVKAAEQPEDFSGHMRFSV